MKMNVKDLLLMYLVAIGAYILAALSAMILASIQILASAAFLLILLLPGVFYFYRNKCDIKTATLVSGIFGFTFPILFLLIGGLLSLFIQSFLLSTQVNPAGGAMLLIDIPGLVVMFSVIGLFLSIWTLMSYLAVKHLISTYNPRKEVKKLKV
jgi:hypothetical protein